jgi:hypothetical protein
MNAYTNKLMEMGIAETRVAGLNDAMEKLNSELCKLDLSGLRAFTSEFGVIGHLDQFAQKTGSRNVAREVYAMAINKAQRNINLDDDIDFPLFADMLHYSAQQAANLSIPGAKMLCKSLATIRRQREGKIGLSFSRLAARVENVFIDHRGPSPEALKIRLTHKWNGNHQHRDDWNEIGEVTPMYRMVRHEDMDGSSELMAVRVWSDSSNENIKKALHDTFSWHGCSCEHDCCGCVSQHITRIKCLDRARHIWILKVSTTRNI